MRLDKPVGIFLLFWPCAWGLAAARSGDDIEWLFYKYLLLFLLGSILMRTAGCVYNDIIDKKIDAKVVRTMKRPIASGTVSTKYAWFLIFFLILFSLLILFQFNLRSIIFGLSSVILVASYPFMKRITYWPQLFLGITFNWGVILGWLVLQNKFNFAPFVIYFSAIFWTLGYDTIYGMQDIKDDLLIGVKSTSIKFQKNIKLFLTISYAVSILLLILSLTMLKASWISYFLVFLSGTLLIFQIYALNQKKNINYSKLFALNSYYGLSIFISLLIINTHG